MQRLGLAAVKGTRHESLDSVDLSDSGPVGDRVFCLVDPERRTVLRTVSHPTLMALRIRWTDPVLALELPDGTQVQDMPRPSGVRLDFDYWGRRPELALQETVLTETLSDYVGHDVALARVTRPGDVVYAAPLTIVTTSELHELGDRAGMPDPASARFRATLTLDDEDAPGELAPGRRLRLGAAEIEVCEPIPRCAVIDHDPSTGRKSGNLLATLAGYRQSAGEIWFGHYARVTSAGRCGTGTDVHWKA